MTKVQQNIISIQNHQTIISVIKIRKYNSDLTLFPTFPDFAES